MMTRPGVRVVHPESRVADLCHRPAVGVAGETTLNDAVETMRREGVSSLLIDGGRAIVTERDLVRAFAYGCAGTDPLSVAASPHPVTVTPNVTVVEAAALMLNEHLRHLVVDCADGLHVLSLRDLLAVLLSVVDRDLWLTSLRLTIEGPSELWLG